MIRKPRKPYIAKLDKTPDFDGVTKDIGDKARAARLQEIWHALEDKIRAQWVRPLMEVGHSYGSAATALGIGARQKVAGVCWRNRIQSRNKARHIPRKQNIIVLARVRDLVKRS